LFLTLSFSRVMQRYRNNSTWTDSVRHRSAQSCTREKNQTKRQRWQHCSGDLSHRTHTQRWIIIFIVTSSLYLGLAMFFMLMCHSLVLDSGMPAGAVEIVQREWEVFKTLKLITAKPYMYVCNVSVSFFSSHHGVFIICDYLTASSILLILNDLGTRCRWQRVYVSGCGACKERECALFDCVCKSWRRGTHKFQRNFV
jgi:hypothetical protein